MAGGEERERERERDEGAELASAVLVTQS